MNLSRQASRHDPTKRERDDSAPSAPPGLRIRGGWADRLEIVIPLLGYAVAVALGATTSSLGLLRQDPGSPLGRTIFGPREIRSDEWLTQAPIDLGVMAAGHSTQSPLSQSPDLIHQVTSNLGAESVLFWESNILRMASVLPDAQAFSAFRNVYLLLLLLTMPPLLRRLGANRPLSWLATVLTVVAPSSAWWSFMPVRMAAAATTGCYLLILARDRLARGSRWPGVALALAGGFTLPRLATYYVPWGITIGVPLVLATGVYLITAPHKQRAGWTAIGVGALGGITLFALTLRENAAALAAEFGTSYPGLRRTTGAQQEPFLVFGAPGLFEQQSGDGPVLFNQSELSSAFAVVTLLLAASWILGRPRLRRDQAAAALVLTGFTAVWLSWCLVDWGSWSSNIPLLNLLPPIRVSQTLGFPAVMAASLVLSRVAPERRWLVGIVSAVSGGAVTHWAVDDLQRALPTLWEGSVVLVSVATAIVLLLISRWNGSGVLVAAVCVLAAIGTYRVNPIQFGLGDLRDTEAATAMTSLRESLEKSGSLAAGESPYTNALLVANGVPSATGYQVTGPNKEEWAKLDPTGKYEFEWNRGSSYLQMSFTGAPGTAPTVTNPSPDVILVVVDPCNIPDLGRPVSTIVTPQDLTQGCLVKKETLQWAGTPLFVFEVAGARQP